MCVCVMARERGRFERALGCQPIFENKKMKLIFRLICKLRFHYFRIKRWEKYVYLSFILLATCGGVTEKVHLFFRFLCCKAWAGWLQFLLLAVSPNFCSYYFCGFYRFFIEEQ